MASVVIALSAAVYFTTEKIRERKQKKRELKAQQASNHGLIEQVAMVEGTAHPPDDEELPAYHQEGLPAYAMKDQHPAHRNGKRG